MRVGGNGPGDGLYGWRIRLFGSCSSRCKRGEPLLPFQVVLKILASFLTCGRYVNNVANSFRTHFGSLSTTVAQGSCLFRPTMKGPASRRHHHHQATSSPAIAPSNPATHPVMTWYFRLYHVRLRPCISPLFATSEPVYPRKLIVVAHFV